MAKVVSYRFPQALPQIIARDQAVLAGGSFILNGEDAEGGTFEFENTIRKVAIWAETSNESTNTFTITGTLYGKTITEDVIGPDATLAPAHTETDLFFSTVTSVTVLNNTVADDTSVGTGESGYTNWFLNNYYSNYQSLTVQVWQGGDVDDGKYTFQTTLEDVPSFGVSEFEQLSLEDRCNLGIVMPSVAGGGQSFDMTMKESKNPDLARTVTSTYAYPTRYSRVKLEVGLLDESGEFEIKMLEQG